MIDVNKIEMILTHMIYITRSWSLCTLNIFEGLSSLDENKILVLPLFRWSIIHFISYFDKNYAYIHQEICMNFKLHIIP